MYQVDERDEVVVLDDVPQSDVGAPVPALVATEHTLDLLYMVSDPDPDWDGTYVNVVGPDTERELIACIRFDGPYAHMFGPPNDEAFKGHPLASRGLERYSAWEVRHSSWIRALERMNAVHPYHKPAMFEAYRHFIFAFHDSTFECVAKGYGVTIHQGSIASVASSLTGSWA